MLWRNSWLLRVLPSLSLKSSIASTGLSGFKTLRRIQVRWRSSLGMRSSSLRVPLRWMSMAGKTRLSTSLRSRMTSMLPVPLNSSKMTSSMRLPVSMRAEAMMVSEPPSSMLRAGRDDGVVGAREAGDAVQEDDDVALVLNEALGLLDDHLGYLDVACCGLVEGGADDFALDAALHVGDFFRAF